MRQPALPWIDPRERIRATHMNRDPGNRHKRVPRRLKKRAKKLNRYLWVNRRGWGPGPWDVEPDREVWRAFGLGCLVSRGPFGAWCGYVAVPRGHPAWGTHFEQPDVESHWGLTYAGDGWGWIQTNDKRDRGAWYLGFDCGHAGDYQPGLHGELVHHGIRAPRNYVEPAPDAPWLQDRYRTIAFVKREVHRLAYQLAMLTPAGVRPDDPDRPKTREEAFERLRELNRSLGWRDDGTAEPGTPAAETERWFKREILQEKDLPAVVLYFPKPKEVQ